MGFDVDVLDAGMVATMVDTEGNPMASFVLPLTPVDFDTETYLMQVVHNDNILPYSIHYKSPSTFHSL